MKTSRHTIGQLARATGTKAVTIRYYEKEGLLPAPARTPGGYRLFSDADRDRLLFIRRSRRLGFSLEDIRSLLTLADRSDASCEEVDAKVAEQLEAVRGRIRRLRALESELEQLGASCQGGGVIGCCRIIESLSGPGRATL
ncbi:MerR family transcriptional regulator [Elongatibacter sediminis]|uniref:Helix-turn-helix domain-containing protein n=1 Tax=Elongatibacter sediminis TaxID=3119006 RepID=A0AAW9RCW0_9GAMM